MVALQANRRANSASNDTQSITSTNDEIIEDNNTDAVIDVENTDNAAIDAENIDNAAINADNTSNAATDNEKSDDAIMSDNNTDNATTVDGNMDNTTAGETSTVQVPLPPHKIKTSTKHMPTIAEPSIGDPLPNENATAKASGHTVDPTDVCIYEFLIQGAPRGGIEEDQLLEIQ